VWLNLPRLPLRIAKSAAHSPKIEADRSIIRQEFLNYSYLTNPRNCACQDPESSREIPWKCNECWLRLGVTLRTGERRHAEGVSPYNEGSSPIANKLPSDAPMRTFVGGKGHTTENEKKEILTW